MIWVVGIIAFVLGFIAGGRVVASRDRDLDEHYIEEEVQRRLREREAPRIGEDP